MSATPVDADRPSYPRARRPDRYRRVDSSGIELAVYEWGDPDDPPLMLAHGGFDFAGTFDVFAPLLAAGGWRVISWDQRGHGDSGWAALYQWSADMRDSLAVFKSVSDGPLPVVGHSKGGSLMIQIAATMPHLISSVVNIDGLPSNRPRPDVQDVDRKAFPAMDPAGWLDHRRSLAGDLARKPGTLEDLARRRGRMNPRLTEEWLTYIAGIGARQSNDGWRWKLDPAISPGGFGPWRPEWSLQRLTDVSVPLLIILASEPELMGFGTTEDDVAPYMPPLGRVVTMSAAGHFIHIERPDEVAELALEHLEAAR